ncbi:MULTISPECIES: Cd(II)/Pb(II)-responsive transcriptional regulator [Acinetobacter]|uniref:Cd(II)/Pb(II)-responsive transcriptional regulator n=1 Tax=Acinetobacter TaxID=469 RepID=UPI00044E8500|nr:MULTISPECIES: Cd(II)/Pb(II)-responsive transcriptional regulator [Acinetobacter]MDQ9825293.1 Cd(II)/Pb(II)-responsive transcriptional regulator [Acinetobacter sp. 163]AZC08743.1 Cd(II)/Pb(II)-responsive transcriptional regulator [Acinetobacter nosocomialis]EHU1210672.1 Cd(II)/Pb(II)-responsive transcriptional regulator [Acinetobacter nosocomialis]EXR26453.1 cd(II)/Pb(II)-responsive transcriptional regulator [Acinetobacter sp. 1281984]MBM9559587.1 Cd(II)/Pb(II)-responsive transcriptional reg
MFLKIGELSEKTSCSVLTIRFYEKEGLIPQPERNQGNYRLYSESYIDRLKFIVNCRSLNMNLSEIKKLLSYKDIPNQNCSEVNELIDSHIKEVQNNIRKQQKLIEQLLEIRKTCDGMCNADQCGVLKNLG